jgi:hypothetical protein
MPKRKGLTEAEKNVRLNRMIEENENLYQAIIRKLSTLPVNHLKQVDDFLREFTQRVEEKQNNAQKTLSLAGAWANMAEDDFAAYLQKAKTAGQEAFGRSVDL